MNRKNHGKPWRTSELQFLRENRESMTLDAIATKLGRTHNAVQAQAQKAGLAKFHEVSREEEEFLRENVSTMYINEMAAKLGRTEVTVRSHLEKMGILDRRKKPGRTWTSEEEEFLRRQEGKKTVAEIDAELEREKNSVYHKMRKMGLRAKAAAVWTAEEDALLLAATGETVQEKAEKLGKDRNAVYQHRYYLRQKKKKRQAGI